MDRKFPPAMIAFASNPALKKAFILDYEVPKEGDCENCGGLGYLYVFAATDGPYQSPAAPYQLNKSSKWHDGKWWIGTTAAFACPVCGGLGYVDDGRRPVYVPRPEHLAHMDKLVEKMAK